MPPPKLLAFLLLSTLAGAAPPPLRGAAPAEQADAPRTATARLNDQDSATTPSAKKARRPVRDRWADVAAWPDPVQPCVEQFRENLAGAPPIRPTGLSRADYLRLIEGNAGYFLQHQNADGAIIDPYKKVEWQYATPCFAQSAALLIQEKGRKDLVEPAARAMDWATKTLSERKAASAHEDFFAPTLAHAFPLLKPHVPPERYARWEENIRRFDPYETYRSGPGGANWNVVSASGDYLFHKLGLREKPDFTHDSIAEQGRFWSVPTGMYTEGPMPYDHFPRLWAADLLAAGYDGPNAARLAEVIRRAALLSLFMQSPTGELPTGGRSSHHQWNEAEQCVTFEIFAARARQEGDTRMAAAFKRAARLALASMFRWQRPGGELWIVKNRIDPARHFGYESYSAHSQYNLLAMSMLAIAWEHAAATEDVAEGPAPADVGGFVLNLWPVFHKVFANAGGTYVELDTAADPIYNPTGLLRVHRKEVNPQIGPSDGLSSRARSGYPEQSTSTAVGVAWKEADGNWKRLAEYGTRDITNATVLATGQSPERVAFQVIYEGPFSGPSRVSEHYEVTPERVTLRTRLGDYSGPTRMTWPVLAEDGERKPQITRNGNRITVALDGSSQTFIAEGARTVELDEKLFPGRNGWYRVAVAEFPEGTEPMVVMEPRPGM